jgi:DNA gyrase subunit B
MSILPFPRWASQQQNPETNVLRVFFRSSPRPSKKKALRTSEKAKTMNTVVGQFEKRAETYSGSANWISDQALIRAHQEACERTPPGQVLELCCGTGMVGRSFQASGWHVCGIDLTRKMAEEANRFFPCICAPVENVPFLDNSFDVVVLRQAYFLLENGQQALAQAHRVLKPHGVFVLSQTVPYGPDDAVWLEKVHRTKQAQLRHFYTEEDLVSELQRDHFRVERTRRLSVRENITRWMNAAPELSEDKRAEVVSLIANAPQLYRNIHGVNTVNNEVFENWNWVIFTAHKKQK